MAKEPDLPPAVEEWDAQHVTITITYSASRAQDDWRQPQFPRVLLPVVLNCHHVQETIRGF